MEWTEQDRKDLVALADKLEEAMEILGSLMGPDSSFVRGEIEASGMTAKAAEEPVTAT
jgi:hypothetical protein